MASWKLDFFGTKTAVATEMSAATLAQCVSFDPGQPLNTSDTVLIAHFNAAIVMAQAALAALVGAAPNAKTVLQGYYDTDAAAPIPATGASRISVLVSEFWN